MDDLGDIWGYPHFRKPPFGARPPSIQPKSHTGLVEDLFILGSQTLES